MKRKCIDLSDAFENRLRAGLVEHAMQTNSAVEPNKNIKWSESPWNQFGRKGGQDLPKSQVVSSEWKSERVREDANGDSEDEEDDELPCVTGENEGDYIM